jgi:hypothetical protein
VKLRKSRDDHIRSGRRRDIDSNFSFWSSIRGPKGTVDVVKFSDELDGAFVIGDAVRRDFCASRRALQKFDAQMKLQVLVI